MKVDSIYKCVTYIFFLQFIFAASSFRRKKNKLVVTPFTVTFTNIMLIVPSLGMFFGGITKVQNLGIAWFLKKFSPLVIFIAILEISVTTLNFFITGILMQVKRGRHIEIYKRLDAIDKTFIREFKVDMCYNKLLRKNIALATIFISYYTGFCFTLVLKLEEGDIFLTIFLGLCYVYMNVGLGAVNYASLNVADIIRIRFRLIQKLTDRNYLNRWFRDIDERSAKIQHLFKAYKDLYNTIEIINDVFGVPSVFCVFHDFSLVTCELFLVFWKASENETNMNVILGILAVMIPSFWKMILYLVYSHFAQKEGENCIQLMSQMDTHTPSNAVRISQTNFLYWLKHNSIRLSVAGFFSTDMKALFSVFGAMASYLLVLVQFKIQEQELAEIAL